MRRLDMEYWSTHCGVDGYLYLLFQRRILKLVFAMAIISLTVAIPINMHSGKSMEDWFERTTLNNKEMTQLRSWVHVALIGVFSFLTARTISAIRSEAREAYKFYYKDMSKNRDHEWLKVRTVHVKGILPQDRRGDNLKKLLDETLAKNNGHGSVLGIVIVPDFVRLFNSETKKKDLEDL